MYKCVHMHMCIQPLSMKKYRKKPHEIHNKNIPKDKICVLHIDCMKEYLDIIKSDNSVDKKENKNKKIPLTEKNFLQVIYKHWCNIDNQKKL